MIVGVIGSGAIGPDLAYGFMSALASTTDSRVFLVDIKQAALDAGVARIRGYLDKAVARGVLTEQASAKAFSMLVPTQDMSLLADCDYVLEAASEDLAVKEKLLAALEAIVRKDCLIGFATSGLPRKQIAKKAAHPERCFVNHPFFPAWRALPIEVVLSGDAAMETRMLATLKQLGKVPIVTADVECFAADDIFCNYISEAARLVEEGIATVADVDAIVNAAIGGGGPFQVMDLTKGNVLTHKCQLLMQHAPTGSSWFAPPPILLKQGDAAWHARGDAVKATHDEGLTRRVMDRILAVLFARTYFVVEQNIASCTDTNWLSRMALGFRKGLLEFAEDLGPERVRELCLNYEALHPGFYVPRCIREGKLPRFCSDIKTEIDGSVGIIRVFRPEVKNALRRRTLLEIDGAVAELNANAAVSGIVLTSYDGSFAGADIGELAALQSPAECKQMCESSHPIFERVSRSEKPIVALVDGPVMGGGAELAMACHARVVGPSLTLAQPEVNLGILPGYGGTQRLPRLIGIERAARMIRTGQAISAKDAVAWGWGVAASGTDLMQSAKEVLCAPHSAIDTRPLPRIEELADVELGHRSLAIDAIVVDVLQRGLALELSEGLLVEADGFARCKQTVDMDIGMKNFIQNGPRVPAAFLHE